ncbi:MAG: hypothetical protein PVJ66_00790 [Gammaproteobacteria bacterium]
MQQTHRKLLSYFLAFALAMSNTLFISTAAAGVYDQVNPEPSGGAMLADMVLMRPFMLVSTVVGVASFVVTLPFSALGGNVDEAGRKMVLEPAKYTFVRPLGEL